MAIVVESVSAVATANSSALTITKPTGLAEGNLMVAVLFAVHPDLGSIAGDFWNQLSGWTMPLNSNENQGAISMQYKLADSGDVAASNFTFTFDDNETLRGYIIRASGNMTADDPLGTTTVGYTPPVDGALMVAQFTARRINLPLPTISGYTAPGITFTEGDNSQHGDGTPGGAQGSAYGIQTTAEEIDTYSAAGSNAKQFAVFLPPVNATGTNTLITTTSEALVQTGTCDTVGSVALVETTAEALPQTGQATSPTQWTNEAKPSTTWVNENK